MSITLGMITKNSLTKMGNVLDRILDKALEFKFDDLIVVDEFLDCSTMIADFETKEA